MSSIQTNPSAMTALQALTAVNKSLATVQSRISTGFRVAEAKDNAAYWSIATTMRSDNKVLSTVQDSLGLGASRVDTAYTAMNAIIDTVDEIKQKVLAAIGASEGDKVKIQTEIDGFRDLLRSVSDAATFSGQNWLAVDSKVTEGHPAAGDHRDTEIVASFTRSNSGAIILGKINIDINAIKLYDAAATTNETKGILEGVRLGTTGVRDNTAVTPAGGAAIGATNGYSVDTLDIVGFSDEQVQQMLTVVDETIADLTDAATLIGAAKKRVDMQKDFASKLMDSIDRGIGQLVDADMNQESTRLQALQVQQQLGIQSLQIANSSAQNILTLFRGQ
jgi:flagellin